METKQIKISVDGFSVSGKFFFSPSKFMFEIESVSSMGQQYTFEAAQDNGLEKTEMDLAMLAGVEAGIDYTTLCDMTWLESR